MDVSTVISIQNQLVTYINKTIKASTDDEIVVERPYSHVALLMKIFV